MIVKAGLLLSRDTNDNKKELLFVRPRGRSYYILPGGKQEKDETIEDALIRELEEELKVGIENIRNLGIVEGATPDGRPLKIHLFGGAIIGTPIPSAEIEEILWISKDLAAQKRDNMTPMSLNHLFPFLTNNRLW